MNRAMKWSCFIAVSALLIQIMMAWNFWPRFIKFERSTICLEETSLEVSDFVSQASSALAKWQGRAIPSAVPLPHFTLPEGAMAGQFPEIILRGTSRGKMRFSAVVDIPGVATGLVVQRGPLPGRDLVVIDIGFDCIDVEWQGRRRRFQLNDGRDRP